MAESAEKHVLVVEDDKDLLASITSALQTAGYSVIGASTPREATFRLKNQKYACVVLDLKLGEESGVEVVDFIRTRKDTPNHQSPILVASGYLSPEIAKGLAGKIQGAIVKPFEVGTLVERVKKLSG